MEETDIVDAIEVARAALAASDILKNVYDHIPSKPSFPCVIIAPSEPFVDEAETFTKQKVNVDIWIVATPSSDNKTVQQSLYKSIAKAITLLEAVEAIEFDSAGQPVPVEYNQTKTIASIIAANILI